MKQTSQIPLIFLLCVGLGAATYQVCIEKMYLNFLWCYLATVPQIIWATGIFAVHKKTEIRRPNYLECALFSVCLFVSWWFALDFSLQLSALALTTGTPMFSGHPWEVFIHLVVPIFFAGLSAGVVIQRLRRITRQSKRRSWSYFLIYSSAFSLPSITMLFGLPCHIDYSSSVRLWYSAQFIACISGFWLLSNLRTELTKTNPDEF